MTRTFLTLFLFVAAGIQLDAADSRNSPFATVVRRGDTIVATLPTLGMRYVVAEAQRPRITSYGEPFQFRDGTSVLLYEKHSSYRITCHISPPPAGLRVESTFNAQSFGGTTTKKNYFIDAK
jgi:hypothetical protein